MQENSALGRAIEMVRELRKRCSWDRVQTRETLRPYLVEEVLELDQALADGDTTAIRDEVSDFLLHLAWQLVLAEELGDFTPDDVAGDLERKMRRRHPHLFELGSAEPWERLKRKERLGGTLDGLPPNLPDLLLAFRLQERAAGVGFDWPDAAGPVGKIREELGEVEGELAAGAAGSSPTDALREEIGDLLFAVVNLARKTGVQPGAALDGANRKFKARFAEVERMAGERGIELHSAGIAKLDELWEEVKGRPADRPQPDPT